MKKIIALTAMLMVISTSAFAAEIAFAITDIGKSLNATADSTLNLPAALIGKMSKGVYLGASYSATGYALSTYHQNGTKQFGTAFDATAIYVNDIGAAATPVAPSSSVA